MEEMDQEIMQSLLSHNPRFRLLYEEHVFFERQLRDYDGRTYLTPEEDIERKKLQKMKLAGKDEMQRMICQHMN